MPATSLIQRLPRHLKMSELRVFVAVLEHRSFRKAAAVLHLSQPAVTKAIAGLEETLGFKLFDRVAHGVEPTVHGRSFAPRAVAIFDELRRAAQDLTLLSSGAQGSLRVGTVPMPAIPFLPVAINRLVDAHPGIFVSVVEERETELLDRLRKRDIEFAILRLSLVDPATTCRRCRCSTRSCASSPARPTRWPSRRNLQLGRAAAAALGHAAGGLLLLRARAAHARPGWTCRCRATWSRRCRSRPSSAWCCTRACWASACARSSVRAGQGVPGAPALRPAGRRPRRRRRDAEVARAQPAGAAAGGPHPRPGASAYTAQARAARWHRADGARGACAGAATRRDVAALHCGATRHWRRGPWPAILGPCLPTSYSDNIERLT